MYIIYNIYNILPNKTLIRMICSFSRVPLPPTDFSLGACVSVAARLQLCCSCVAAQPRQFSLGATACLFLRASIIAYCLMPMPARS